jgi:excisionase family DNA binding protein
MSEDKLLSRGEVAALFRVGPRTVSKWIERGRLPESVLFRTPGRRVRFIERELLALMADNSKSTTNNGEL